MSRHVLIIGGMGPQASLYAHHKLIELAHKSNLHPANEDYPRITHLSINVQDFISNPEKKDAAKKYIIECLNELSLNSVDVAFIACNTAHMLLDDISPLLGSRLVSMIDETKKAILGQETIGLVATPSTIRAGIYHRSIEAAQIITPSKEGLVRIESIIRRVIAGTPPKALVDELAKEIDLLIDSGANRVVLGCSELSMFHDYLKKTIVIDPVDITVRHILSLDD